MLATIFKPYSFQRFPLQKYPFIYLFSITSGKQNPVLKFVRIQNKIGPIFIDPLRRCAMAPELATLATSYGVAS